MGASAADVLGGGSSNAVSESNVLAGLWTDLALGLLLVAAFCCLQRRCHLYRYRETCPAVTNKPRPLATSGLRSYFDWALRAAAATDLELLQGCGLDALVLVKACSIGVQLFALPCVLGLALLLPLHRLAGGARRDVADRDGAADAPGTNGTAGAVAERGRPAWTDGGRVLGSFTLSSLPYGSHWMWLHFFLAYVYLLWGVWLLGWHTRQFAIIRTHYLRRGDGFNVWRELYAQPVSVGAMPAGAGGASRKATWPSPRCGSSGGATAWRSSRPGNVMGGMLWLLPARIRNMLPDELPLAPAPAGLANPVNAAAPAAVEATGEILPSPKPEGGVAPSVTAAAAVVGPAPPAALRAASSSLAALRVPPLPLAALRAARPPVAAAAGAGGTPHLLLSGAGSSLLAQSPLGAPLRSLDAVKSLPPPAYLHAGAGNPPSANSQPYRLTPRALVAVTGPAAAAMAVGSRRPPRMPPPATGARADLRHQPDPRVLSHVTSAATGGGATGAAVGSSQQQGLMPHPDAVACVPDASRAAVAAAATMGGTLRQGDLGPAGGRQCSPSGQAARQASGAPAASSRTAAAAGPALSAFATATGAAAATAVIVACMEVAAPSGREQQEQQESQEQQEPPRAMLASARAKRPPATALSAQLPVSPPPARQQHQEAPSGSAAAVQPAAARPFAASGAAHSMSTRQPLGEATERAACLDRTVAVVGRSAIAPQGGDSGGCWRAEGPTRSLRQALLPAGTGTSTGTEADAPSDAMDAGAAAAASPGPQLQSPGGGDQPWVTIVLDASRSPRRAAGHRGACAPGGGGPASGFTRWGRSLAETMMRPAAGSTKGARGASGAAADEAAAANVNQGRALSAGRAAARALSRNPQVQKLGGGGEGHTAGTSSRRALLSADQEDRSAGGVSGRRLSSFSEAMPSVPGAAAAAAGGVLLCDLKLPAGGTDAAGQAEGATCSDAEPDGAGGLAGQSSSLGATAVGIPRWWTQRPLLPPPVPPSSAPTAAAAVRGRTLLPRLRPTARPAAPTPAATAAPAAAGTGPASSDSAADGICAPDTDRVSFSDGGGAQAAAAAAVASSPPPPLTAAKGRPPPPQPAADAADLEAFLRRQLPSGVADLDLHRPSVGHRKTVNAVRRQDGVHVSVLAQHYAVLVTAGQQPLYGPYPALPARARSAAVGDKGEGGSGASAAAVQQGGVATGSGRPTPAGGAAAPLSRAASGLLCGASRRLTPRGLTWPRWFHWSSPTPATNAAGRAAGAAALGSLSASLAGSDWRRLSWSRPLAAPSAAHVAAGEGPAPGAGAGGGAAGSTRRGRHRRCASDGSGFASFMATAGAPAAVAVASGGAKATDDGPPQSAIQRALLLAALAAADQAVTAAGQPAPGPTPALDRSSAGSRRRRTFAGATPPGAVVEAVPATGDASQHQRRHKRSLSEQALLPAALAADPAEAGGRDGTEGAAGGRASTPGRLSRGTSGLNAHSQLAVVLSGAVLPTSTAAAVEPGRGGAVDHAAYVSIEARPRGDSSQRPTLPPVTGTSKQGDAEAARVPASRQVHTGSETGPVANPAATYEVPSASERWALVREAVAAGEVAALRASPAYCAVSATFARLFPDDFDRAVPVVRHKEVDQLLRQLDEHVALYDAAVEELRQSGQRPMGRLGRWLSLRGRGPRVDLIRHHRDRIRELRDKVQAARRAAFSDPAGTGSWLVFFRSQQAAAMAAQCAIHPEREEEEEEEEEEEGTDQGPEEKAVGKGSSSTPRPEAEGQKELEQEDGEEAARQRYHSLYLWGRLRHSSYFRVSPAPGPDEVNWPALWLRPRQRWLRRVLLVRPLAVALLLLVPVGIFAGGLQQLNSLLCPGGHDHSHGLEGGVSGGGMHGGSGAAGAGAGAGSWPWYCSQRSFAARLLQRVVVGAGPALLVSLWQGMVLPVALWLLVQAGGLSASLSGCDLQVAGALYLYGVANVFLGGVAGSALMLTLRTALSAGPSAALSLLGAALPASSNFFLSYLAFRTLVAQPLRLLIPHVGLRLYLLRRYVRPGAWASGRCAAPPPEREVAVMTAPVSPRYGFEVGMLLLVYVIAGGFMLAAPLLLPVTVAFFAAAWLFWRQAFLGVYVRQYEGGGRMWALLFSRLVGVLGLFAAFSAAALLARGGVAQGVLLLASAPPLLLRFHTRCARRYRIGEPAVMPLDLAATAPLACVDPWTYMPPPLHHQAAGWHPDWSVPWRGWNLPPYSV